MQPDEVRAVSSYLLMPFCQFIVPQFFFVFVFVLNQKLQTSRITDQMQLLRFALLDSSAVG